MRLYSLLIAAILVSSIAFAYHDAPPQPTKTTIAKPFLKGSPPESFGLTRAFQRYDEGDGLAPRYHETRIPSFTKQPSLGRLTVSPATRAYRSLGPITHPAPNLKPTAKPGPFSTLGEKRQATPLLPTTTRRIIP